MQRIVRFWPLLLVACSHTILDPGPLALQATSTPSTPLSQVCWVEFAQGTLPHGMVVAHHVLKDDVPSTQSGLWISAPQGNWLIDGGSALDYVAQIHEVPSPGRFFMKQAAKGWTDIHPSVDVLAKFGLQVDQLSGMIATHGHFDHLGGLADIPNIPVYLPQAEIDLVEKSKQKEDFTILPGDAQRLSNRTHAIPWENRKFLLWDHQWDVYGDGRLVVLDTPGHTPGSLSVYVSLQDGRRVLLVGDTVWVKEGYETRSPKGAIAANFDADPVATDMQIAMLWSLHQQDPGLIILPAHDRRVWTQILDAPGCIVAPPAAPPAAPLPMSPPEPSP